MNKKKSILKATLFRTVVLLVVLTIVGATLVSCSGCSGSSSKKEAGFVEHTEKNELTSAQLKTVAEFILNNADKKAAGDGKEYTLREMFTAAYRGIDMTAAGFVDAEAEPVYYTPDDVEETSDAEADEETTVAEVLIYNSDIAAGVKILGSFGVANECVDYDKMNAYDMRSIVNAMQTELEIGKVSGFLNYILYYIGVALNWVTGLLGGSYILGLLVFAILMELLLIFVSIKQQKNSIKQAMLDPKEKAIRKKYAGRTDNVTKQKMNEEIQAMYQRENFNQLSGCLPLLLSLPLVMALYYIIIDPLQYMLGQNGNLTTVLSSFYQTAHAAGGFGGGAIASSRGTIEILANIKEAGVEAFSGLKDFLYFGGTTSGDAFTALEGIGNKIPNFKIGSVNLGYTPAFSDLNPINVQALLLLVPILVFVSQFFSMRLTKKWSYQSQMQTEQSAGCSGKIMEFVSPLLLVVLSFRVPAAVGVYWIFKSIVGVVKQFVISKAMPLPKFTEEDYKAAERELMGKSPKKNGGNGGGNGDKPRSLHYIDDDEYETVAPVKKKSNAPYVEDDEPEDAKPRTEEKKEKKNSMLSGAEMKEYDENKNDENSDK